MRPVIGEAEIEFLKRHGVLKNILDGHKKFKEREEMSVGHLNVSVPNLLQQTGVFSGTLNTERHVQKRQNLANCAT